MTPTQERRIPITLVLLACLFLTAVLAHFTRDTPYSNLERDQAAAAKEAAYDAAERARLNNIWNDLALDPCLLTHASYTRRPISFPNDNNGFRHLAVYRVEICERAEAELEDLNPSPEK